jgi:hypothetical protein
MIIQIQAFAGSLFTINVLGNKLVIAATIPNHVYPNAGIKINTSGFAVTSGCTPSPKGFCLFSTSNISPAPISLQGGSGSINLMLCLNALGPVSCQNYDVSVVGYVGTAYIVNSSGNSVSVCPVFDNGSFGACTLSSGNGTFNEPLTIVLNAAGTLAYIPNLNSNAVSICQINGDGSFGNCSTSNGNGTFAKPDGLALSSAGTVAYVTNIGNYTLSICPIKPDGTFGVCTTSTGNGLFYGIQAVSTHKPANGGQDKVYVADGDTRVIICPTNSDGSLGACTVADGNGTFAFPEGVAFNAPGNLAYVGNFNSNNVSVCAVNNDGTFSNCRTTNGNGTFNFTADKIIGMFMSVPLNYGYIPNCGNNTVSICPLAGAGNLEGCSISDGSGTFSQPASVVIRMNN